MTWVFLQIRAGTRRVEGGGSRPQLIKSKCLPSKTSVYIPNVSDALRPECAVSLQHRERPECVSPESRAAMVELLQVNVLLSWFKSEMRDFGTQGAHKRILFFQGGVNHIWTSEVETARRGSLQCCEVKGCVFWVLGFVLESYFIFTCAYTEQYSWLSSPQSKMSFQFFRTCICLS